MDKVQKIREEVARIQLYSQSEVLKDILDYIDKVQEEPVSTKDKLRALSDGKQHLGWIDDAMALELEEDPVSEDLEKIVEEIAEPTILNAYGTKELARRLHNTICGTSVNEDLEEASKEWLIPQLDKSYANYGEVKMMELTHFDGYAMLDAIEFGANWQKTKDSIVSEQLEKVAELYTLDDSIKPWKNLTKKAFKAGANWQKTHLWKPADGDDLPIIDREVIALLDNGKVVFAHRPPEFWDGKDIVTGKVTRNYPKTYGKGGWNIPDIVYWLDVNLPKEIKL